MAKGAAQAQDLEKVTDYHEDTELDSSKFQKAMNDISNAEKLEAEKQAARARELAAVTVKAADIDLLASEFEIPKDQAELKLRENKGNVEDAINAIIAA